MKIKVTPSGVFDSLLFIALTAMLAFALFFVGRMFVEWHQASKEWEADMAARHCVETGKAARYPLRDAIRQVQYRCDDGTFWY